MLFGKSVLAKLRLEDSQHAVLSLLGLSLLVELFEHSDLADSIFTL